MTTIDVGNLIATARLAKASGKDTASFKASVYALDEALRVGPLSKEDRKLVQEQRTEMDEDDDGEGGEPGGSAKNEGEA